MSGSEQFLGRQLSKQAAALAELVVKMTQMVISTDASVPKFGVASDVVKHQEVYGETTSGLQFKTTTTPVKSIMTYFAGTMRVKLKVYCNNSTASNVAVKKNGVSYMTEYTIANSSKEFQFDITVLEGDIVEITGSNSLHLNNYKLCYDLINKPDVTIG